MKIAFQRGVLRLRILALRLGPRLVFSVCTLFAVSALAILSGRGHEASSLRPVASDGGESPFSSGGEAPVSSGDAAEANAGGADNDGDGALPFRIIVLTQRRHWSLRRLLRSIDAADYSTAGPGGVRLEIRVDRAAPSADHNETVALARGFDFRHGAKEVVLLNETAGLQYAWFEAWIPQSDDERAVIVEDDMELSPLWFAWLWRAWDEYGSRDDLGGISLCRQRLRASDGKSIMFQHDTPFLYRIPGSFGFSPHAKHWGPFVSWVLSVDLMSVNVDVEGTVTTGWHRNSPDSWEQFWIWWCFSKKGRELYTLYVHSKIGALIGHWAEPGVHATLPAKRNDFPLNETEDVLEVFPKELEHYGWDYELE